MGRWARLNARALGDCASHATRPTCHDRILPTSARLLRRAHRLRRGCYAITLRHAGDERGSFTKLFARQDFVAAGLACDWQEYFSTWSERDVLRGFHFQAPPADYAKLVSCLHGRVLDVALDLRRSSPTHGRHLMLELSAERANAVYLAPGLASTPSMSWKVRRSCSTR